MTDTGTSDETEDAPGGASYDLLRRRLRSRVREAVDAASEIDQRRSDTFGAVPVRLTQSDRLHTDVACSPRDMASVGDVVVLGYNVTLDLAEVRPEHVFALYRRHDGTELTPVPPESDDDFLSQPAFLEEFEKLHKFYGKARFADLRRTDNQLLAAFQIGDRVEDVAVLRWSIDASNRLMFVDGRGDRDYTWPQHHDVSWIACGRDDQIAGAHPAVGVLGEVFIGFRGGRLQLRVEDGTPGGSVAVDEETAVPGQSLADVSVSYAEVGTDILLIDVGLYSEASRYYIVGRRTRSVRRVDAIGDAVRTLPEGEGVVFPGGYHLATTGTRVFDVAADDMAFEEIVASPNGEDLLYVFHNRTSGEYLLAPYNLVRREIAQVIPCHGFAQFDDGAMVLFRGAPTDAEASRVHPVQWWSTPFAHESTISADTDGDPWVRRVGNADLVSGLADVYDVGRLVDDSDPTERTWESVIVSARRALDTNLWMADPEAETIHRAVRDIVDTAGLLVDEYVKLRQMRSDALAKLETAARESRRTIDSAGQAATPTEVVEALGALRRSRGEASLLSDVPEIDDEQVAELFGRLDTAITDLAARATDILDSEVAFEPFSDRLDVLTHSGLTAETAADVDEVVHDLASVTSDLDAVVDAVAALDGGDPTSRTRIVRRVADVSAASNRARAQLDTHRRSLSSRESEEAFDAELALLEQTLSGSVIAVETPDDSDVELARLLVNAERVESRYGDDPDRVARIVELRDRINETFGARRAELVDARARRTQRLAEAGRRLLANVARRAEEAEDEAGIAGFFAADQMVARVRSLADELDGLDESGQAAELRTELSAAAEEAQRSVRDRTDLVDDDGSLSFGTFRFAPNHQPFETVLSPTRDGVEVAVTGTDFGLDVSDRLAEFRDLLDRPYPSETSEIARAEFLAWAVLSDAVDSGRTGELRAAAAVPQQIGEWVRGVAEHRHGEGYEAGVHDHDASRILSAILSTGGDDAMGHSGRARALARLGLSTLDAHERATLGSRLAAARHAADLLGASGLLDEIGSNLEARYRERLGDTPTWRDLELAADCTVAMLDTTTFDLPVTSGAARLADELRQRLADVFGSDLGSALGTGSDPMADHAVAMDWLHSLVAGEPSLYDMSFDIDEAASILATRHDGGTEVPSAPTVTVSGLVGEHGRIESGSLPVRVDELAERVGHEFELMADRWPAYQHARREVMADVRSEIDLDAHRPQVMAGFVRNRLIDRALLPLVGANLARQLGTVGASDLSRSGLLVLTSPPGYGKTTLMAWIAARLGLLMVKVNGPALGADTTSLDPADAPNAAARAEVEKINLAFRMGRNVLLFVDDIQFTSPQFLSRFIPLADATRRIEGVVDDEAVTFDLRGKRFAVVMAGNPYSTGGARFELPDMLVNRADVHNLGDVADEHADDFALSYLENSMTACPSLAPAAGRLIDDIEAMLAMARGRRAASSDGLAHRWDGGELSETVRLLGLLDRAQRVVMAVNAAYVESAAMNEDDRTAPPFLLQGSYRNMARIASRVVPAMTDDELDAVVDDHYRSEAQTLTDRAEQNLLALGALLDQLTDADRERWEAITARYAVASADPAAGIVDALQRIATVLGAAPVAERLVAPPE